jgi:hypothetical protein
MADARKIAGNTLTGINIIPTREQEKNLITYATTCQQLLINQFSIRSYMEMVDRSYMRENDWTEAQRKARIANRNGDAHKIQDIIVPVVMPQVETALAYASNVFLTGYPIFGVAADPSLQDSAMQMETIIAENAIYARWARQLMMFFRDGYKYNLHAVELDWCQKTNWTVETDITAANSAKPKKQLWQGNCLKRMDMYNTFFDPRVHPAEIHEYGEFAGYVEIMSRMRMKQFINDLYETVPAATADRAFASSPATGAIVSSTAPFGYYVPNLNPEAILNRGNLQGFDWLAWASNAETAPKGIRYNNVYQVTRLYARIIPADFNIFIPEKNTPQVFKLTIVNGSVLLQIERLSNVHNYIPMFFGQPIEDGLDYQTKSFAANVVDMQAIATGMLAGYMASKRRLVGDRVLFDPLRVREKDINSTNPAAKIPVRPSAYGKNISEAVHQFPFRDEQTQTLLNGSMTVMSLADKINGQNGPQQGQFQKGNKTTTEFTDTMGHSNDRNRLMALMTEMQVFTPLKEALKLNILQFQPPGSIYNRDKKVAVNIDPVQLRKQAVLFKVSDGMQPTDKIMGSDVMQTAFQVIGSSPQLAGQYNIAPMFSYLMKLNNADIGPFEKSPLQLQYEAAVQSWQQVAIEIAKAGQTPPPQPAMPPELIQELQAKQQTGGVNPSATQAALQSTQGS